ncbi:MAG: hypothetical protein CMF52_04660 [Legionellales bacterium]|nr:hypothetical protein [Legionellales bacterium]
MTIFFCFPYRGVGGVSIVFMKLAEALIDGGDKCYLIDYADGYMARFKRNDIGLLEYRDDRVLNLPEGGFLVFQSMTPWSIFPNLKVSSSTKIFFWNCHPFNLVPTVPGLRGLMQGSPSLGRYLLSFFFRGYRKQVTQFIDLLVEKRALYFMDHANLKNTESYLDIKIETPRFLPIPYETKCSAQYVAKPAVDGHLRISWIGRCVDFKYHILVRFLKDVEELASTRKLPRFSFTIVGQGEARGKLIRQVDALEGVDVRFIDHIEPSKLREFLEKETDLLVATGTSALSGARLGVPTILLDFSYKPVPKGYKYRWISDRDGSTLGDMIDTSYIDEGVNFLFDRIGELLDKPEMKSTQSKNYYDRNHSVDSIIRSVTEALNHSECLWDDLLSKGLLKRSSSYLFYSWLREKL